MMKTILNYATPFTTGLFFVSLISGVFLFFHLGGPYFHGMHEWLSMVLILPFIAHLWRNWRPFLNYFKRSPMMVALAISLIAALAFVVPSLSEQQSGGRRGNPAFALSGLVTNASIDQLAPLYGKTPDALQTALNSKGLEISDTSTPVSKAASEAGVSNMQLASILASLKN